jgi:hypothetical protein
MKTRLLLSLIFLFIFTTSIYSQKIDLSKINISVRDYILLKYDLFFLKNKYRLVTNQTLRLMVDYQSMNFNLIVDDQNVFKLKIIAVMNKSRYQKKRYYPKNTDCNIVRNKLFLDKYGYTFWKRKPSYAFDEEDLQNVLINEIYGSENLSEKIIKELIDQTMIEIDIIHPRIDKSIKCSGKITQVILD